MGIKSPRFMVQQAPAGSMGRWAEGNCLEILSVTPFSSAGKLHGEPSKTCLVAGLGEHKRWCLAYGVCKTS